MNDILCQSIQEHFSDLPDPRGKRNRRHELGDILVIALCGVLSGADDFVAIEEYGKAKEEWLGEYLSLANGIPSHDTFRQVFKTLDSAALHDCFTKWARYLVGQTEHIAIDGKRQCAAHGQGEFPPCSVNAYSCEEGVVLSQRTTENKGCELQALKEILSVLDISGSLISLDAGACYREVAEQILGEQGDYLLAVKKNQLALYQELDEFFAKQDFRLDVSQEKEKSHGRVDRRRTWVCAVSSELPKAASWPQCAMVAMVERVSRTNGKESVEHRYYICSREMDVAEFAHRVRSHWQVENELHWVLDMAFDEDRSRARTGHSAANLVILRQWAFNLLKQENSKRLGIKNKRKRAGWDMGYLVTLLGLAETT